MKRLAVAMCALVSLTACNGNLSPAAAVVNGDRISDQTVEREFHEATTDPSAASLVKEGGKPAEAALKLSVLSSLVRLNLALGDLRSSGTEPSDADVTREVARLVAQAGSEAQFYTTLGKAGVGPSRASELVFRSLVFGRFEESAVKDVAVSEEEVNAAYESARSQFVQVRLFRATVSSLERAEALKAAVGKDSFQSLAKRRSTDELAAKGGDMGWINAESVDPLVAAEIESLPDSELTTPVQVGNVWVVYKVGARRSSPIEDVRERITEGLLGPKRLLATTARFKGLFEDAKIVVNKELATLDELKAEVLSSAVTQPLTQSASTQP